MIDIQHVTKTYRIGESEVTALQDVSLRIEDGEFVAIAGPSGSGKSTLLNLIAGLEPPTRGVIEVQKVRLALLSAREQARWRAKTMGFIFQTFNLLTVLTAYENVEYPLSLQKKPRAFRQHRVMTLLDEVGLSKFAQHRPAQLSGGQRQRLAVARALAGAPALILADEPTANLDHKTGLEIIQLLKKLHRENNVTLVLSTHDPSIMAQAQRVVRFEDGRVREGAA